MRFPSSYSSFLLYLPLSALRERAGVRVILRRFVHAVFGVVSKIWKITIGSPGPGTTKHSGRYAARRTPVALLQGVSINGDSGKVESLVDRVLKPSE